MRKIILKTKLILLILAISVWYSLPTYGLTNHQSFDNRSQHQQQLLSNEITLDNSILENSFKTDKNITFAAHILTSNIPAVVPAVDTFVQQLKEHYSSDDTYTDDESVQHSTADEIDVKIHNDFHYGINKSNQGNISYNNDKQKPATPLLSNIKVVNSSGALITTAAEELATASKTFSESVLDSTNSKSSTTSSFSSSSPSSSPSSSFFERVELQESLTHRKNEKLLLHRNKRYLLFPEGSSFQLVFDLIIPIVDYTNFAIMGITCAVAWELPSKPPGEIIENFRTKLNDGTFGLIRRNDSLQQSLVFINSPRTKENAEENNKRWEEDVAQASANVYNQNYQPNQQQQLSATVATTSAHQNFITNALKSPVLPSPPPPALPASSNFFYNSNGIQPTVTTSFYNQETEQKKWNNYNNNFKTFDANQRKTFYATSNSNNNNNNRRRPIYQKTDSTFSQANNYYNRPNNYNKYKTYLTANEWNVENWQTKNKYQNPYQYPLKYPQTHSQQKQKQPQHTKIPYNDAGDYWNKDNWWDRNRNRIEKQWQENQHKWSQYQENKQKNYQTPMFSKRTGRNRKILDKPPKHRVYPVFGKRRRRRSYTHSPDDGFAKRLLDIHTREHLQTRQKLYGKIEKLYKTRGQNGTACVLRALCETEKMHLNAHYREAPQSFVMELLRSIFALPKEKLTNSKESSLLPLDARYTDAVLFAHDDTQNCSQQYKDCEYSITFGI